MTSDWILYACFFRLLPQIFILHSYVTYLRFILRFSLVAGTYVLLRFLPHAPFSGSQFCKRHSSSLGIVSSPCRAMSTRTRVLSYAPKGTYLCCSVYLSRFPFSLSSLHLNVPYFLARTIMYFKRN